MEATVSRFSNIYILIYTHHTREVYRIYILEGVYSRGHLRSCYFSFRWPMFVYCAGSKRSNWFYTHVCFLFCFPFGRLLFFRAGKKKKIKKRSFLENFPLDAREDREQTYNKQCIVCVPTPVNGSPTVFRPVSMLDVFSNTKYIYCHVPKVPTVKVIIQGANGEPVV